MASQDLKQRRKDDSTTTTTTAATVADNDSNRNKRAKKMAMAKRGLRSLAVAIAVPLALSVLTIFISGSSNPVTDTNRPLWHPPSWAVHVATASTSCLMGLSAWLVWAEGGFHRQPAAVPLYLAQLLLALSWGPLVFGMGARRAGMAVAVGLLATMLGCSQVFRRVNPIAGDLVKPCLAWVSFLAVLNYKLVV